MAMKTEKEWQVLVGEGAQEFRKAKKDKDERLVPHLCGKMSSLCRRPVYRLQLREGERQFEDGYLVDLVEEAVLFRIFFHSPQNMDSLRLKLDGTGHEAFELVPVDGGKNLEVRVVAPQRIDYGKLRLYMLTVRDFP